MNLKQWSKLWRDPRTLPILRSPRLSVLSYGTGFRADRKILISSGNLSHIFLTNFVVQALWRNGCLSRPYTVNSRRLDIHSKKRRSLRLEILSCEFFWEMKEHVFLLYFNVHYQSYIFLSRQTLKQDYLRLQKYTRHAQPKTNSVKMTSLSSSLSQSPPRFRYSVQDEEV